MSRTVWSAASTLFLLTPCMVPVSAASGSDSLSRVCVARGDHILVPPGILAPRVLFPKGRVDFGVVERLVDRAVESLSGLEGKAAWRHYVGPMDNVGIIVDVKAPAIQLATVETIIDRLVGIGVQPDNICVFGGDEGDLFEAGFTIRREGPGVRTYGAASEGYRGGMSRIPSDYCQVLINVATLKADKEIGMAGALANCLACVPHVERVRLRGTPELLPSVAAHPAIRPKLKLNFLEAYLPLLDATDPDEPTWRYRGLIVGDDPVAVDAIGAKILTGCRFALRGSAWPLDPAPTYIMAAQTDFRLGQADPAQIEVLSVGPQEGAFLE